MSSPSDSSAAPHPPLTAAYFDGHRSIRHVVSVTIDDGRITVAGDGIERSAALGEVEISGAVGTAPRRLRFSDGAFCEVAESDLLAALLARQGVAPSRTTQWEGSYRWLAVAAVCFVALLLVAYRYVLPSVAGVVAVRVPEPFVDVICAQVMRALDETVFDPSEVPNDTQWRLVARFNRLRLIDSEPDAQQLLFRKSEELGPNALAIPSGEIVVTDALVGLAASDEEILSVLAHEAGHVVRRHGLRQLFQNSVVAVAVTWLIGDVSMLAAAAPTALLQAKYSRDFEREADAYAVRVMGLNDIPLEAFASILERLGSSAAADRGTGGALAYLSSHPVTAERVARVRGDAR